MASVRFHMHVLLPRLYAYHISSNRPCTYYLFDGRGARFIQGRKLFCLSTWSVRVLIKGVVYLRCRVQSRKYGILILLATKLVLSDVWPQLKQQTSLWAWLTHPRRWWLSRILLNVVCIGSMQQGLLAHAVALFEGIHTARAWTNRWATSGPVYRHTQVTLAGGTLQSTLKCTSQLYPHILYSSHLKLHLPSPSLLPSPPLSAIPVVTTTPVSAPIPSMAFSAPHAISPAAAAATPFTAVTTSSNNSVSMPWGQLTTTTIKARPLIFLLCNNDLYLSWQHKTNWRKGWHQYSQASTWNSYPTTYTIFRLRKTICLPTSIH